ncbi:MAG: cysteine dioxygenase family protein [Fimbriimonadaceae bacterium]|nr:cysteine dioxygenase family protein [Fimbriimonadaceae bacterium]QYK57740.1 MAG: cysteine dioxygenase family protein [Fimbriimonadaceae bacterium]
MVTPGSDSRVQKLIARLDEAVETDCVHGRCDKVKAILEEAFHSEEDLFPAEMMAPDTDKYARRLLHRDPQGRYSVVVMVWGVGQGTALHDHAGEWCVECVYRGRIKVTSFDLVGSVEDTPIQFRQEFETMAGVGEAGALIPPYEYHTIANGLEDRPSVTVHVYGHELSWCHVYLPVDGGFERVRRDLCYTS